MNTDFPRILTLLRKERGISQKQAAKELNISQALLSHYEKGIRECGLDFIVKTANFYDVSCDYLLGLSPERTGATLSVTNIPEDDTSFDTSTHDNINMLNKRIVNNSFNVVFDLLAKTTNANLVKESTDYLMLAVYNVFRTIYSINPKNEDSLFTVNKNISSSIVASKMLESQANIYSILDKKDNGINIDKMAISSTTLEQDYPRSCSSLFNLIKFTENKIKNKNCLS